MNLHLTDQKVIVFGAARGIGRAIADAFAAEGCRVIGVDLDITTDVDPPSASHLERPQLHLVQGDITDYDQLRALAADHPDTDHVVFSVGLGSGKSGFPFWKELEPSDWRRVLDVNLIGAVNVAHAFAPAMAERARGSFLFLVSVAGQIGSPTDPPYSAAKAGLINFTQCMARDLAEHQVRANALAPGMVRTDLNQSVWRALQESLPEERRQDYDTWARKKIRAIAPLGNWQEPHEFASMATYLASDHCRNLTGQTLNIDGGQVMHA